MRKKIIKLGILIVLIIVLNVVLLSRGLLNFSIHSENIFVATCSVAVPIISFIILFFYGYLILNKPNEVVKKVNYDIKNLNSDIDYKNCLKKILKTHFQFTNEIEILISQVDRIQKKHQALLEFLEQNDNSNNVFLINESESAKQYLLNNIKSILNKFIILEALDKDNEENQRNIFEAQLAEISEIIENNEKTLDEYDIFLEEISKIGEKSIKENIDLQCTITAMRQLRGANSKFQKGE